MTDVIQVLTSFAVNVGTTAGYAYAGYQKSGQAFDKAKFGTTLAIAAIVAGIFSVTNVGQKISEAEYALLLTSIGTLGITAIVETGIKALLKRIGG